MGEIIRGDWFDRYENQHEVSLWEKFAESPKESMLTRQGREIAKQRRETEVAKAVAVNEAKLERLKAELRRELALGTIRDAHDVLRFVEVMAAGDMGIFRVLADIAQAYVTLEVELMRRNYRN